MPEETMNENDVNRYFCSRAENLCQSKGVDRSLRDSSRSGRNNNECFNLLAFVFDLIFDLSLPGELLATCRYN